MRKKVVEYLPPANEVWGKVTFLHLSVILFGGGGTWAGTTWASTPPSSRYTTRQVHPSGQVHPLGRYPPGQVPPWAGTSPGQVHPLAGTPPGQIHPQAGTPAWTGTPQAGTPLGRYTPWADTPPGMYTPQEQCMLGDTGNKWAVRILLECILVVTVRNKVMKVMFLHLSVCPRWGGIPQCMLGYSPQEQAPSWSRPSPEQAPPRSRHPHPPEQVPPTPREQTPPPGSRHPPPADGYWNAFLFFIFATWI